MATKTSPGPGAGVSVSFSTKVSRAVPRAVLKTAFMLAPVVCSVVSRRMSPEKHGKGKRVPGQLAPV
ncbi:hypothetical protein GCM10007921_14650 [Tritonibacter mobilis]|nr:hypothetical protein GCM10007921_14650 [Tritonibacter mobilis]